MLTLIRLVLIPFIVIAMIKDRWGLAFGLYIIASITDVLDGWVARTFNQRTFLGAALDPITDKILFIAVVATLAFIQPFLFTIPLWFVIGVLFKEAWQITGSVFLYVIKGHLHIAPTILGKANGLVQTIFITWLFSCYFFHWAPFRTYYVLLTLVGSFVVLTLLDYTRIGICYLRS